MTVTYSLNVANARLTGFTKLLLRWKGSIYKLLYREVIIFCGLYYMLSMSYRYLLNDKQKLIFEKCVEYCRTFTSVIPLSFVLGFYVSIVVTRWWQQFMQIPWPDKAVLLISGYVRGDDERGRIIRRTLARYLLLMQVLTFQAVSTSVRRRFPTLDHIQEVGLFTAEERMAYDEVIGTHGKWWVPAQWFISLIIRARRAGRIKHDYLMDKIIEELHCYRTCCGMMFAYDWISIPLVYTQTVSIATYMYFCAAMIGRQYLDPREGQRTTSNDVDYYIPVFTILEFLCFMGWLKVAEQLINPYGEDDDDFELNWCLDRNLLVSFTVVDEMYNKHPKLVEDAFYNKREPILPYTKSSLGTKLNPQIHPHSGSTVNLAVEPEDFLPMETIMEEDHEFEYGFNYSSPPTTSMVDYANVPNWHQDHHSVIQMDDTNERQQQQQQHPIQEKNLFQNQQNKSFNLQAKDQTAQKNVSQNHSELIENLKTESNQSSRCASRTSKAIRFLPDFIQDSKIGNLFFGGSRSTNSQNSNINPIHQPNLQYQNYSNLLRHHNHQRAQHQSSNTNSNTFLLRTPTKKQRHHPPSISPYQSHYHNDQTNLHQQQQQQPHQQQQTNDQQTTNIRRPNASVNQTLMINQQQFLMNSSNASIGGNQLNNNFNTSLSAATITSQTHLSNSHQNLTYPNNVSNTNINKVKLQNRKSAIEQRPDDLTSSTDDQTRFEEIKASNHRNLRLNRLNPTNLNSNLSTKYCNLPTAPVLPTFSRTSANSSSLTSKNRMSPFMNRLRNSFNFSSHHYRSLNRFGPRNKRNSFSSAISLKSKCDQPTSDQMVTSNGFHFPQAFDPPKNLNQYLPLHLQKAENNSSITTIDQATELNNNSIDATNLNKPIDHIEKIEFKFSPASDTSLSNCLNEDDDNLIVMDDLHHDNLGSQQLDNNKTAAATTIEEKNEDDKLMNSSNYTIEKAAAILKASNENDLTKLKSSVKITTNNQQDDSVPFTSAMTSGIVSEKHSKSSSAHSSSADLNKKHELLNEKQSLINKNETETSSSSNSNETNKTTQTTVNHKEVNQNEDDDDDDDDEVEEEKPYSPNEDCHEDRYEESPTSSNDSLSPYESNQNTVSSYTQLLEKEKNNGEY